LTRFELEGSNGFSILVASDRRQHLMLETKDEEFSTEYLTKDTIAAPDRIQAKLPGLGSISVRFHPRGPARHPSIPGCNKKPPTVQPGVVRGTIKFTGERGYTTVVAHEATAETEEPTGTFCHYNPQSEPIVPGLGEWTSKFVARGDRIEFSARKYEPGVIDEGAEVRYLAETGEALEAASGRTALTICRSAAITAPASTFREAHPEHLTISPPPPFAGTGALSRTPESVFTWGGDLAVQFPGIDPVPLAGSHYDSRYCRRGEGCLGQRYH
jgi:hypothetical protein